MNIDVGKAISELLFEHPTVIVPGLGGFTSSPESAMVDYVQGMVTPPAKKLEFNPNLVINDGTLVGHIQKRDEVTAQQAKEAVESYVGSLQDDLSNRKIIEIPAVGRIYKDYEQRLKFMAEGTNFEANSFGLPSVKFTPVSRVKEAPAAAASGVAAKAKTVTTAAAATTKTTTKATAGAAAATSTKAVAAGSSWLNKLLPALILLAAIVLALSLFMILRGGNSDNAIADVKEERVNVKPPITDGEKEAGEETAVITTPSSESGLSENNGTTSNTTEGETSAPANEVEATKPAPPVASSEQFIVIHSFGVSANAKKFEKKLKRDGYTPKSKKHDGLYRVGILMEPSTNAELENVISRLGKKYKSTPKVVDY